MFRMKGGLKTEAMTAPVQCCKEQCAVTAQLRIKERRIIM
jgi:hypothetical protein